MRSSPERPALLAAGIAAAFAACGDEGPASVKDTGPPYESLAARPCPEGSILTWDNFGGPFFYTYCNGCHSGDLPEGERQDAPVAVNFDTVEDIRRQADRVWIRAADQNAAMPPAGAPGDEERARLGEWLACGAPGEDNSAGAGGGHGTGGGGAGGGGPQGCDGAPNCDLCIQCSVTQGSCKDELDACYASAECAALTECNDACPADDPATATEDENELCQDGCAMAHPDGVPVLTELVLCVLCDECTVACDAAAACP